MSNANQKRRCLRTGCKAWAMPGSEFCHGHNQQALKTGGAPKENQNARKHGLYSHYLSPEEKQLLESEEEELSSSSLDNEIAAARIAVMRAIQSGDSAGITRGSLAVGRLLQIKRQLAGEQATGIVDAINQILAELGLGESGGGA